MLQYIEADPSDLTDMLELYNYYIENTTVTFDLCRVSLDEFLTRIHIMHSRYKTFLIKEDEVFGFCFLNQFRKKPAYDKTAELGVYLKPQFVRRGFGQKAVQYLETIAKKNGIEVLVASICGGK